jgi:protein-S-isoprenylcysteine O-methyltransferase Ste14
MPPPVLLLLSLLIMTALRALLPGPSVVEGHVRWIGVAPLIAGVMVNLLADRAFHRARTTVKPDLPTTALLTDGVFRWTRNPMYLGFVLILVGIWTLFGRLTPGAVPILFVLAMDRFYIPPEEEKLRRTFGEQFLAYTRKVPRWI